MPDILHKVGIKSSTPQEAYAALTTIDGLSRWWTSDTRPNNAGSKQIRFTFGEAGFFVMDVLETVPGKLVRWQVADGPEDWVGTTITFEISEAGDYTIVLFKHAGWREPSEAMHHCSTKWAMFLMSLKSLLETGKGQAHPDDAKIDNWN